MTDTIGQRLKKAREYRKLSFEKVSEATRIRIGYLKALEADDYSAMPSPVHAKGFLRNYAQYLDLDLDQVIEELQAAQSDENSGTESKVLFEGEKTIPSPTQKEFQEKTQSRVEVGGTPEETATEPFWQTWLRRAKSEVGELDAEGEPVSPLPSPFPLDATAGQKQLETEQPAKQPTTLASTAPDSHVPAEAGQSIDSEASENGVKADLLIERMKTLIPRRKEKPAPKVEIVQEQEPRPEPKPVSEPATGPETVSQEIINDIGMQLRRRREMLSLSLDEIERHTRLRVEIMDALEKGNFDELPSPVQTRGMLANYAGFLDLEVDALLLRFADALQARHRERYPVKPARRRGQKEIPENVPTFRTFIAGDVIFGIGMVLLLVAFAVWGISRVIVLQSEQDTEIQAEATGPSISEALIGTPVETVVSEVTLIPAEDTPIPGVEAGTEVAEETSEIPTLATNANVQLNIVALERSFLRVTVDGEVAFEGRTIPGNAYPFEAEQSIEVLAGNGSALRVIYNQRDMGLLGGFGQIASFIYTVEEVLVPTPAMSPTVTNTPFISPTPTITPSPTLTPSPTVTPADLPVDL